MANKSSFYPIINTVQLSIGHHKCYGIVMSINVLFGVADKIKHFNLY